MNIIQLCGDYNYRLSNLKIGDSYMIGQVYNTALKKTFCRYLYIDSFAKELYAGNLPALRQIIPKKQKSEALSIYLKDLPSKMTTLAKVLYFFDSLCLTLNSHTVHTQTDYAKRHDILHKKEIICFHDIYAQQILACNEYALLLQLILQDMGFHSALVCGDILITKNNLNTFARHSWVEISVGNASYILDPFHPCRIRTHRGKQEFTPIRKIHVPNAELSAATLTGNGHKDGFLYSAQSSYDKYPFIYGLLSLDARLEQTLPQKQ